MFAASVPLLPRLDDIAEGEVLLDGVSVNNPDRAEIRRRVALIPQRPCAGERPKPGTHVSAGGKQVIAIARAFVADLSLLVIDEGASSVDTRTELLVQMAMAALRTDCTTFVIAHWLSTIRDADTILNMENGKIVEQGNHKVLLAAEGAYYRLCMSEFAGADAGELPVDTSTAVHS